MVKIPDETQGSSDFDSEIQNLMDAIREAIRNQYPDAETSPEFLKIQAVVIRALLMMTISNMAVGITGKPSDNTEFDRACNSIYKSKYRHIIGLIVINFITQKG